MDLDTNILIFGFLFISQIFPPTSADGSHGHADFMSNVHSLKTSEESYKDNMKSSSEKMKIYHVHDVKKIVYLDLIHYIETDLVLGTSEDSSLTFDLLTYSPYSFQQQTTALTSSFVETDKDVYIKVEVGEKPGGASDYVTVTMVLAFCLLVILSKLMNYKSKFKGQRDENDVLHEGSAGLMWNFTNLENFVWKRVFTNVQNQDSRGNREDLQHISNEEQETEKRTLTDSHSIQSKCSLYNGGMQCHKMKSSPIGQKHKLKWTWCLGILFLVTIASVLAVSNFRQKHVLNVAIPPGAIIRKIRSYSTNPDLSAISLNSSSMSLVTRVQLLHTSCLTDKSQCETYARCETDLGHMTCRCKRGFFYKDRKCRACSTSCKEGYYMSKACTSNSDLICRPCTQCSGASYEVAACSGTQDTICIGAAFPADSVSWNKHITQSDDSNITLTTSSNVFHERLGKIRKLESSMFLPNNAQSQAFPFIRETGLQVKVEVSNLYLIPKYIDIDHENEYNFLRQDSFQNESSKTFYQDIRKDYCRHQLPDKYKITLYIIKNHTSSATEVKCNSKDTAIPECPMSYKDGQTFLNREFSTDCPHDVNTMNNQQFLTSFIGETKSIVCPYTTKLFTDIFGKTVDDTISHTFPTKQCKTNEEACRKCLKYPSCRSPYEGECCDISCYTDWSCQTYFSDACPVKEVECATGDLHIFTLEPVFTSIEDRFMCHMKYKEPPHLYQIDYTVNMTSINYAFKKRTKFVKGDKSYNEKGEFKSEFLRTYHNAFPEINDEIILMGTNYRDKSKTKYSVHGIKKPHQFNTRKQFNIRQHKSLHSHIDIYSTHVQVESPFLYSSQSFNKGGCLGKNFSDIYPPQPLYLPSKIEVKATETETGAGFEYLVPNAGRNAYIRIYVDNSSILSYFQDELPKSSIIGQSLSGAVSWNQTIQTWTIKLQGKLEVCPGYFTVEVFDQFMESKLETFDIFVKCPVKFNLNFDFKTPNTDLPNVFVACINDSYVSHHVLLSILQPPLYPPTEYALTEMKTDLYQFPWIPIIVTFIFTCIIFAAFIVALLVIYRMKPVKSPEVKKFIPPQTTTYIGAKDDERNVNQPLTLTLFTKPVSKSVFCTLCTLYIVYAVIFTFSILLAVFYIVQGPLVGNLTIVSNTSAKIHESVSNHMAKINKYEETELRLAFNQTFRRLRACSVHIQENINKVDNSIQTDIQKLLRQLYLKNGILDNVINGSLSEKTTMILAKLAKFQKDTSEALEGHFGHVQTNYLELLRKFKTNAWLKFPKERFIDQQVIDGIEHTFEGLKDFMRWLEIDGVEQVLNLRDTIMDRLKKSMSDLVPAEMKIPSNVAPTKQQVDPKPTVNLGYSFGFQILEQGEAIWTPSNFSELDGEHEYMEPQVDSVSTKAKMIDQIREIMLPVFICFFISMDILMLSYRFVWLKKSLKKAKTGVDIEVPTDHVAEKIQFWQTGQNNRKYENVASTENPYNFLKNKEDILSGKTDPLQLYANTAEKSKQEILRELWMKKQKEKRRSYNENEPKSFMLKTLLSVLAFLYKHLIAPILWRFVLVGAFILVICLVTKATSDLVSIETATFLIDTKSIIPQLHRQVDITNRILSEVTFDLNNILKEHKSLVDSEVVAINSFLTNTVASQNEVLQKILVEICAMTGDDSICSSINLRVHDLVTSCNFLPVSTSPFTEMDEGLFIHYLHSELVPLVNTLRQILFNTCYILFVYACLMLVSHMLIRIIIYYLIKTSRLPKAMIYLVSNANDCWKGNSPANTKSMYSNSIIESCESGVVGDIEDHRESIHREHHVS